ncbi:MAG TPA: FHA domain-containing protein [Vicinamibacterales bacterium]|nr:FHA domain-containing protein [Vicinamibacterales bacterium]
MNRRMADLVARARHLESSVAAGVEGAARAFNRRVPRHDPLETVHAIVDALEHEVQPAGRGRHAFPFNQVHVQLAAATPHDQARLDVAIEGPPSLHDRIAQRLEAAGCERRPLEVRVSFVPEADPGWRRPDFHVTFARIPGLAATAEPALGLELTITHGKAARSSYAFDAMPITIGRGEEVRDRHRRLIRTNHVVFVEGAGDANDSVSRQHAHLDADPLTGGCRLFDDGSAQGTTVIRQGRGIPVLRGTRGLRLQIGDEIVLGQARLRVSWNTARRS